MLWVLLLLLSASPATALEDTDTLAFAPDRLVTFQPDMPVVQEVRIIADYSGRGAIRVTDANLSEIDELVYRYVTVRSEIEERNYSMWLILDIEEAFFADNHVEPGDLFLFSMSERETNPLAYVGKFGHAYRFNVSATFGSMAVIGRPKEYIRLGYSPTNAREGQILKLPILFENHAENATKYVFAVHGVEGYASSSVSEERVELLPGGKHTAYATVILGNDSKGTRSFSVVVYSDTKTWTFPLTLDVMETLGPRQPNALVITAPARAGRDPVVLRLANPTGENVRFTVSVDADWAEVSIAQGSLILLEAGSHKDVEIYFNPLEGGEHEALITVEADGETVFSRQLALDAGGPVKASRGPSWVLIIAAVLVVLFLLFKKKGGRRG
ncbi:MAG: hypothetical protein V1735_06480 [Nanoarchaeota archaeon]